MKRQIRLQISSATLDEAGMRAVVLHELKRTAFVKDCAGVSISFATAIFTMPDTATCQGMAEETECNIVLNEAETETVLGLWLTLRHRIPGVDCGRIYDRGLSWCAKAYDNARSRENGWHVEFPEHDAVPVPY